MSLFFVVFQTMCKLAWSLLDGGIPLHFMLLTSSLLIRHKLLIITLTIRVLVIIRIVIVVSLAFLVLFILVLYRTLSLSSLHTLHLVLLTK